MIRTATPSPLSKTLLTRRSALAGFAGGLAAVMVTSACSGGAQGGTSAAATLKLGQIQPPNSMDPAKVGTSFRWYITLAYDPLIYRAPDGSLQPRLAESWSYPGTGNKEFELKLRTGVVFSDGSPLTAEVVKANIEYYRKSGGFSATYLSQIASIETPDPLTVRLTLKQPDPDLPYVFSQDYLAGNMISGEALKNPQQLATQSFGAGPYVLDPGQTVSNDHYTYVVNPKYWNPQSVFYKTVTVKVLPNPNTALSALKVGQVDVIRGDYTTADSAKSAGLQVAFTPYIISGLILADRAGKVVPALGDLRVRQALNHAVDRVKVARALLGEYGAPTEQIGLPGTDGFNESTKYPYDVAKARQLLADAGYPDGISIPVLTTSYESFDLVTQAIASELKNAGITLQITNESSTAKFLQETGSGRWAAFQCGYGFQPVHLMGPGLYLPNASPLNNPFQSSDPELVSLYNRAAAADESARGQFDKQIVARIVDLAWLLPVMFQPVFFFSRPAVAGVQATPGQTVANPVEFRPST